MLKKKSGTSNQVLTLQEEFRQREAYLVNKIRVLQEQNRQLDSRSWWLFWNIRHKLLFFVRVLHKLDKTSLVRKYRTFKGILRSLGLKGVLLVIKGKMGMLEDFPIEMHVVDFLKWQREVEPKTFTKKVIKNNKLKVSIIMPVWNVNPKYLERAVESVIQQTYQNWELCMYDDASTNEATLAKLKEFESNPNIKIAYGDVNHNISIATNKALELATGEFVLFLDNDDTLSLNALNEIVSVILKSRNVDVIYYDEDIVLSNNLRVRPLLKPDWSPEMLDATMYLAHATYRKSLVDKLGGMRPGFEGSQDYDLILRARDITQNIIHIPKILYHWRRIPGSTSDNYEAKSNAAESAKKALRQSIFRRKLKATLREGLTPPSYRFKYQILNTPLVSIIIPIRNKYQYLKELITSIEKNTNYKKYEIIIMDNQSDDILTLRYLDTIRKKYKVMVYDDIFNYSAINNKAVSYAKGSHILLLNNDMKVISKEWLESLLEFSQQDNIGVVGGLLLFEDSTIQHAGCAVGMGGVAGHLYRYSRLDNGLMNNSLYLPLIIHNVSAVTGACMMVKKSIFKEVGGLDEKLKVAFNDIDFCLKVIQAGYRNVYTPFAKLYHYESKSRGYEYEDPAQEFRFNNEIVYFKDKWKNFLKNGDPYFNPNFSRDNEFGELNKR